MLRKLSVVLSAVAALGLAFAVSAPADAKEVKNVHVNRSVHVNRTVNVHRNVTVRRNVIVDRNVNRRFVVGKRYHGHVWYGHNRHRWHGRWYDYGVGPCWINVDGLWFWNVVACPP
jgi:hypothetical protein